MLCQALSTFTEEAILLTLTTRILWDQFCLVEACFAWGSRFFTLPQDEEVADPEAAEVG